MASSPTVPLPGSKLKANVSFGNASVSDKRALGYIYGWIETINRDNWETHLDLVDETLLGVDAACWIEFPNLTVMVHSVLDEARQVLTKQMAGIKVLDSEHERAKRKLLQSLDEISEILGVRRQDLAGPPQRRIHSDEPTYWLRFRNYTRHFGHQPQPETRTERDRSHRASLVMPYIGAGRITPQKVERSLTAAYVATTTDRNRDQTAELFIHVDGLAGAIRTGWNIAKEHIEYGRAQLLDTKEIKEGWRFPKYGGSPTVTDLTGLTVKFPVIPNASLPLKRAVRSSGRRATIIFALLMENLEADLAFAATQPQSTALSEAACNNFLERSRSFLVKEIPFERKRSQDRLEHIIMDVLWRVNNRRFATPINDSRFEAIRNDLQKFVQRFESAIGHVSIHGTEFGTLSGVGARSLAEYVEMLQHNTTQYRAWRLKHALQLVASTPKSFNARRTHLANTSPLLNSPAELSAKSAPARLEIEKKKLRKAISRNRPNIEVAKLEIKVVDLEVVVAQNELAALQMARDENVTELENTAADRLAGLSQQVAIVTAEARQLGRKYVAADAAARAGSSKIDEGGTWAEHAAIVTAAAEAAGFNEAAQHSLQSLVVEQKSVTEGLESDLLGIADEFDPSIAQKMAQLAVLKRQARTANTNLTVASARPIAAAPSLESTRGNGP